MFLSIVVPVYNAELHLEECLHSLFTQDLPQMDYEVICVDDGSTDKSGFILKSFSEKHQNLTIITQENSGVATARNTGLSAARGDYIWFVDADDVIQTNILRKLRGILKAADYDQLIVGGFQFEQVLTSQQMALGRQGNLPDNVPGPGAVVWRSLIRRSFLSAHRVNFRHPELTHGEDGQFMFELSLERPTALTIRDTVYFYRIRPGSAETADSAQAQEKKLRSHIAVASIMLDYYQQNPEDSGTANRLMSVLWNCLYGVTRLPLREARHVTATLRRCGLFPFRRPKSCTLTQSFLFPGDTVWQRLFDWVYLRMHTRLGFFLMWLLYHIGSIAFPNF